MFRFVIATAAGAIIVGAAAFAAQTAPAPGAPAQASATAPDTVCKYVVAAGPARENKPYQLCQSKEAWAAKAAADARNGNRMVCRYEQETASRIKVGKRCQTADQWAEEERQTRQHVEEMQARTCPPDQPC